MEAIFSHQVTFKYALKQGVITPLGTNGFVDICGLDRAGNKYYVKTAHGGEWFDEEDLRAPFTD